MNGRRKDTTEERDAALGRNARTSVLGGKGSLRDMLSAESLAAAMKKDDARIGRALRSDKLPPRKTIGRPKGKQQTETLDRINDAAALVFLKYPQSKMVPLLYPGQHVPEAGRKTVNKLLNRNKNAIAVKVKTMTDRQAKRIAKSLPRDNK